ncbi:MAG: hypothetical protein MI864_12245, partial [Pseudomonadales bacterium]|nr:hypothetical protein [Pseudomonadales bacterium]
VYTIPGRDYEVLEINKVDGSWILLDIEEAVPSRRWVALECGVPNISVTGSTNSDSEVSNTGSCQTPNTYDSHVLALSWQAGFCEHYNYSGRKEECDNLNSGNIVITNITIHGLWPNKRECGRNYGRCSNEPLSLEPETLRTLAPWMPNFYYSSKFGEHEWSKHGTCQARTDDEYFLLIQKLAKQFDDSALGSFLRTNLGKDVNVAVMEESLKEVMGANVVNKIELRCVGKGKKFVNEFWINLPKEINGQDTLAELVNGATDKHNFRGNCASEIHIESPGI